MIDNELINLKKGKDSKYPFNDPYYMPRVIVQEYEVIRDDVKITRTRFIDTNPAQLPSYAQAAMYSNKPSQPQYNLRNSPKNKRGKWIRPYGKFVFTKLAVQLIKDGFKDSIINPISHKIKRGYLRIQRIFPPERVKVSW